MRGTVRRPVRSIISWRRAGSRSTRIFSIWVTPFAFRSRSAMRQKGQMPVAYMRTRAIGSFLHRQARLLPRREAALELVDGGEALPLEDARCRARARAALARHDHGLVLVFPDLGEAFLQLAQRDVPRPGKVAGGEIGLVAHVEHQRRPLVHETGRLERADLRGTCGKARDLGPERQHAARQAEDDAPEVVEDEVATDPRHPS